MNRQVIVNGDRGRIARRRQPLTAGVIPTGQEDRLQGRHRFAFNPQMSITPKLEVLAAIQMLLTHVEAANVTNVTINHGDLAMVAVADRMQPERGTVIDSAD